LEGIEVQALEMATHEDGLERGYAHLGWMMLEVAEMGYWRVPFRTFGEYVKTIAKTAKRSPGILMKYFCTVRDLCDTFNRDQLEKIGITKAIRLRAAKDYAPVLPPTVVNAALDPNISDKDLKKVISIELKMPEEEPGEWFDGEMEFIVTPEERVWIESVLDKARHTEPLTKTTISKSAQQKEIFFKLLMEFDGAHAGDGN
jgi:hypothetical protein